MRILTKAQFDREREYWIKQLALGAVFMYPTDTIYGIGCDATNKKAVETIRLAKQRDQKPLSVIVPSKEWIRHNCDMTPAAEEGVKRLPGPFTLLLTLKNTTAVAPNVTSGNVLGVRIPKHWWSDVVSELGKPVVTTSVNISGQPHARSVWQVPLKMKEYIEFAVDDGELKGAPSTILDCTSTEVKEITR